MNKPILICVVFFLICVVFWHAISCMYVNKPLNEIADKLHHNNLFDYQLIYLFISQNWKWYLMESYR